MKKQNKLFYLILFSCLSIALSAQISIQVPYQGKEVFFIDHLFQFTIANTSTQALSGQLEISINDINGLVVASIHSDPILLTAGSSKQARQLRWPSGLQLGFGTLSQVLQQSGRLPFGEYVFCYQFVATTSARPLGVNCQEKSLKVQGQPTLIYPLDQSTIDHTYPQLSWRPPLPLVGPELHYSLKLVPLKERQSPMMAMEENIPLLHMHYLKQHQLLYPISGIPLKTGEDYVWQITAYYHDVEIGKTDIWQFSIQQNKEKPMAKAALRSYRFVKPKLDGTFYIMDEALCFAYTNRAYDEKLAYKVYENGRRDKSLLSLPPIKLKPGLNQIDLEEEALEGIEKNKQYTLKITDSRGDNYFLSFLYQPKN